ncbi:hypothetical protein [Methyloterricola oryzae]|uniref:hypothetical protein n=1 Tax=Methyloterricola oryzae TaxID=1495050 RepID=UPI0005EAE5A0|nr:hypothetical protein [Methyloterricola oryzae]
MKIAANLIILPFCALGLASLPPLARSSPADLEEAKALLQQMHEDQCQQQELRGKVMLAHRDHDDASLKELWPKVEAISAKLKPAEERMKVLKANLKQNADEQDAFETALLESGECG